MKEGLCPDMPLFVNDWLSSTSIKLMTLEEEGAYLNLLLHAWNDDNCCLPDNDKHLAALSKLGERWYGSKEKIKANFQPDPERPGKIFNAKQRAVRAEQKARQDAARARGQKGAQARWEKKCDRNAQALPKHSSSNATASAKHVLENTSSPVSPLPSPEESLFISAPVEPLPSFPKSHTEAVENAPFHLQEVEAEFVKATWNKAMSRGGRDGRDIPIRNWGSFVATEWKYEQERREKLKQDRTGAAQQPWAQIKNLEAMILEVDKSLAQLPVPQGDLYPEKKKEIHQKRAPLLERKAKMKGQIDTLRQQIAN